MSFKHVLFMLAVLSVLLASFVTGAPRVSAQAPVCAETYTVVAGDWLSTIAQRYLGDAQAYPVLFDATNRAAQSDPSFAKLTDPNKIEVGQKLCIPPATAIPGREMAGIYTSVGPAADASYLVETIVLGADGQARQTLDYIGKAQINAKGTWTQAAAAITVKLNEQDGKPIDQTLTFTVQGGNLAAANPPNSVYAKTAPDVAFLLGLYTTDRASADGSQKLIALTLLPNMQADLTLSRGETLINQTGTWSVGKDPDTSAQTVTVNLMRQNGQAISETYMLQVQDGNLRGTQYDTAKWGTDLTFTKYQAPSEPETPGMIMIRNASGTYSAQLPAADAVGRVIVLDLTTDGKAVMTTQFVGKGEPIVETGTWTFELGDIAVNLDAGSGSGKKLVFKQTDGTLVLQDPVAAGYGSEGLTLVKTPSGKTVRAEFGGVSFAFDEQLAKSAQGASLPVVPVQEGPALGGGSPAAVRFLFDGAQPESFFDPRVPQVYVYRTEDWVKLDPATAQAVADLEALLAAKPTPFDKGIPVLPPIPAVQVFPVKPRYIDFKDGTGIGFVTYYAQDVSPVTADRIFYTFQGLTNDDKYYVAVFWDVTTALLPTDPNAAMGGQSYDEFAKNYETYLDNLVEQLNGLVPQAYDPNLVLLEDMVQTLEVSDATLE